MRMDDTTSWRRTKEITYLTVKEVARRMRVSPMTVYRLVQDGSIPATKFRRSFRIDQADLDNFINNSKT